MSNRGRKPTPTYLKVIRGNPGKRPLNGREPKPPAAKRLPPVPEALRGNEIASQAWRNVTRHLRDMRALSNADTYAIEQLAFWYSRWRAAQVELDRFPSVLPGKEARTFQQNPWFSIARRSSEMVHKWSTELGLTPSSRSRIMTGERLAPGDELFD